VARRDKKDGGKGKGEMKNFREKLKKKSCGTSYVPILVIK
jgi:hypothetical protein